MKYYLLTSEIWDTYPYDMDMWLEFDSEEEAFAEAKRWAEITQRGTWMIVGGKTLVSGEAKYGK